MTKMTSEDILNWVSNELAESRTDTVLYFLKVEAIANANGIEDLAQGINVGHYMKLRHTDKESFKTAFYNFPQISKPAKSGDLEKAFR